MEQNEIITRSKFIAGFMLCVVIGGLSIYLTDFIGKDLLGLEKSPISAIMVAILLGILVGNTINLQEDYRKGTRWTMSKVLRIGIVLLGIRLGLSEVFSLGLISIPLILFCLSSALIATHILGYFIHTSRTMKYLVAAGTAICGATAIVAISPGIKAKQEETSYAIANITLFGILAMMIYPYLVEWLFPLSPIARGLMLGTAIHETSQVAGAALIYVQVFGDSEVLNVAVLTKLLRNSMMIFIIPYLTYKFSCTNALNKSTLLISFPLFILGFILMSLFRTLGDWSLENHGAAIWIFQESTWTDLISTTKKTAELCLIVAMAGVGIATNIKELAAMGIKPFYIGLIAALTVGMASYIGISTLRVLGLV